MWSISLVYTELSACGPDHFPRRNSVNLRATAEQILSQVRRGYSEGVMEQILYHVRLGCPEDDNAKSIISLVSRGYILKSIWNRILSRAILACLETNVGHAFARRFCFFT